MKRLSILIVILVTLVLWNSSCHKDNPTGPSNNNTNNNNTNTNNNNNAAAAPAVSSIAPTSGSQSGGTAVTITGTDFRSGASVLFGSVAATNVTVVSATSITATTPAHGFELVDVIVKNADAQQGFLKNGFQYAAALHANPGGPYSVDAGRNFVVNGLGSTSNPYPIAHYNWDCGQSDNGKPCKPDSPTPTFEYVKKGKLGTPNIVYTLTLTVVDTAGNSDTATTTVSVRQTY